MIARDAKPEGERDRSLNDSQYGLFEEKTVNPSLTARWQYSQKRLIRPQFSRTVPSPIQGKATRKEAPRNAAELPSEESFPPQALF